MEVQLDALQEALGNAERVVILPHNDPDPDAIASAVALQFLLSAHYRIESEVLYNGAIGRAENRALVDFLDGALLPLTGPLPEQPILLVDTQPGAGNHSLPRNRQPVAVFDHHPLQAATAAAPFADVRPDMGACATILTGYLQGAGLIPPPPIATALFYGIKSDTLSLARGVSAADVEAYVYLQPLIDADVLVEIERAQVPADYFRNFSRALRAARIYHNLLVVYVGRVGYPDMVGEVADWLLRLQGTRWVVALGVYKGVLRVAVRTRSREGGAGRAAQAIVGEDGIAGGHGSMAGGQVPLEGRLPDGVVRSMRQRALAYFGLPASIGRRLMKLTSGEARREADG
ncbi:MAG: DHH family phosphoesterase [Candidatus Promineifilaceae bacterium]|nr:DHH family phosphoesterase [Candidatus Promineifilaceae bacterium]